MPSDPSFIAGVGLLSALSTIFLGLALAVAILALLRLGDGKGANRVSLIIVFSSFAIAAGAWVFVLAARNSLGLPAVQWYALAGLLIGLLGGLLPRLVGIPVLTLAVLAMILGASEVSAWHPWQAGLTVVELKVFAADQDGSLCGLSMADRNAVPVLQNLRLAPGPLVLSIDVLAIEGPLAFFFGSRHYRLARLGVDETVPVSGSANGTANGRAPVQAGATGSAPAVHIFPFRRGILDGDGSGSPVTGFLGISRLNLNSDPLPAEDLAQGSYILQADGSLASIIR
ncbi:MAG: hypothetical protein RBT68_13985 [Spirochaetia bacterium]|jgi:hypothetical protein|nr:hypothetical protein [Spirochaetia bacterium]